MRGNQSEESRLNFSDREGTEGLNLCIWEEDLDARGSLKYSEFNLPVEIKQSSIYLKYKVQKQLVIGDCISLFTAKFYVTR